MNADAAVYLDSSALVKLVVEEPESEALTVYLTPRPVRVASALVRIEVPRAVREHGAPAVQRAMKVIAGVRLIALDDGLLDAAAVLDDSSLRSLDAIHISAALSLAEDLGVLVTYDSRMRVAAEGLGLSCGAPG